MQCFISGGRMDKSEMSYKSFVLFVPEKNKIS